MFSNRLTAALVVAAASFTGFAVPAHALEGTQDDFMIIFKMKSMDTDKDGMISKKEFMATMSKAFDMKAKEMGAKDGMLDPVQIEKLFRSLYPGG